MLSFTSHWPAPVLVAIALLVLRSDLFRNFDPPARSARVSTIDGLRGFLALSVFFGHAVMYRRYLQTGVWAWSEDLPQVYGVAAQVGVQLFFMITGFLFWQQALRNGITPYRLCVSRIFRLGPLYLAAVAGVFALVAVASDLTLRVSPSALLWSAAHWLALGIVNGAFYDLNGVSAGIFVVGVTWSLVWEWRFYACLPVLGYMRRHAPTWSVFAVVGALWVNALHTEGPGSPATCMLTFGAGIIAAELQASNLITDGPQGVLSVCTLVMIVVGSALELAGRTVLGVSVLAAAFYLIAVARADLFGLLTSRPAVRLGEISYGIYLLQGLALAIALRNPIVRRTLEAPALYWLAIGTALALLLTMSLVAHALLERPGIEYGRRLLRRPALAPWVREARS